MNERIQELFKRAGGKTSIHNLMSNPVQHREYNELWDENITKFAELLIRECMKAADEGMAQVTMKVEWPSYHIKKHFGVEE
jgi:hypothetical protein